MRQREVTKPRFRAGLCHLCWSLRAHVTLGKSWRVLRIHSMHPIILLSYRRGRSGQPFPSQSRQASLNLRCACRAIWVENHEICVMNDPCFRRSLDQITLGRMSSDHMTDLGGNAALHGKGDACKGMAQC